MLFLSLFLILFILPNILMKFIEFIWKIYKQIIYMSKAIFYYTFIS